MSMTEQETISVEQKPFELWDASIPFPSYKEIADLDIVTHVTVEKGCPDGYRYLHETAIAWHNGTCYLCWANHRHYEINFDHEMLRGCTSTDGLHWSTPELWLDLEHEGIDSCNHPVLFSHAGKLWGFFTCWQNKQPGIRIYTLNESTKSWEFTGAAIPGFLPFRPPMKLSDGNWIIAGEFGWTEAGVATSNGDDFTQWTAREIPRSAGLELMFPETTLMDQGDQLVAMVRTNTTTTAPVAISRDHGHSWTALGPSNFPIDNSKTFCGRLSTGQHFYISNSREEGRGLLTIAVTRPGEKMFCTIWKLRHQHYPVRRLFPGWTDGINGSLDMVGSTTEWSYPAAVEHEGKLYISYTQGKEDCVLSIIPIDVLAVEE